MKEILNNDKKRWTFVVAGLIISLASWTVLLSNWVVHLTWLLAILSVLMIGITFLIWWYCVTKIIKSGKTIIVWLVGALHILFMATTTLGVYSVFSIYDEIGKIAKMQPSDKMLECKKNFSNMTGENFQQESSIRGLSEFYTNFIILGIDKLENKPCLIYNEDDVVNSDSLDEKVNKINKKIARMNDCLQLDKGHIIFNVLIVIIAICATGEWIKLFPKSKDKKE